MYAANERVVQGCILFPRLTPTQSRYKLKKFISANFI
jgi:hypothetical protein